MPFSGAYRSPSSLVPRPGATCRHLRVSRGAQVPHLGGWRGQGLTPTSLGPSAFPRASSPNPWYPLSSLLSHGASFLLHSPNSPPTPISPIPGVPSSHAALLRPPTSNLLSHGAPSPPEPQPSMRGARRRAGAARTRIPSLHLAASCWLLSSYKVSVAIAEAVANWRSPTKLWHLPSSDPLPVLGFERGNEAGLPTFSPPPAPE